MCLVACKDVSGEVGKQHQVGNDVNDTELPQPCGTTQACMSFPVDVEDDSDDDLPAGVCGHEPAAFVCTMLALSVCELRGCTFITPSGLGGTSIFARPVGVCLTCPFALGRRWLPKHMSIIEYCLHLHRLS